MKGKRNTEILDWLRSPQSGWGLADQETTHFSRIISDEIQRELDWEAHSELLINSGWTKVVLPDAQRRCDDELAAWSQQTLSGLFAWYHSEWLFENKEDAMMFVLTWL